jgi:hypothetical protein
MSVHMSKLLYNHLESVTNELKTLPSVEFNSSSFYILQCLCTRPPQVPCHYVMTEGRMHWVIRYVPL